MEDHRIFASLAKAFYHPWAAVLSFNSFVVSALASLTLALFGHDPVQGRTNPMG
jgi:hypothetical protein